MRVLVTGAGGFLGSHLVTALRARGDEVLSPEGDARDAGTFASMRDVDVVYHLAARSHVGQSRSDPVGTWDNNVGSTLAVLEWARSARPRRLVLMSSAHVYGPSDHPLQETSPWQPSSPYGASKVATEALGMAYGASYGLDIVRVRAFNVYGPRQAKGFLVPDILSSLASGRAPGLHDSSPRRDFTFVSDAVEFLLLAGSAPGAAGQAINLGSGAAVAVDELARVACEISGTGLRASFQGRGRADALCADIAKARGLLGWSPQVSLQEGLRITWREWAKAA